MKRAWMLGMVLSAVPMATAADAPPEADQIELPPMIIEAKNAPLRWRYLEQPGFELLTVCSDKVAIRYARRHQRLTELLEALVPPRYLFQWEVPELHILFNEEVGRARSREVLAELLGEHGARIGADGRLESPATRSDSLRLTTAGLRPTLSQEAVYFLPNLRLNDPDSMAVFSILAGESPSFQYGFTEARVRFMLEHRAPALPEWLVAGLLGAHRSATLEDDEMQLQPLPWTSSDEARELRRDPERPRELLPMEELLRGRRPPSGTATPRDARWSNQCSLFVRWALTHRNPAVRTGLWRLVDRLEQESLGESMVRECLGLGYADLRDALSDYLPYAVRQRVRLAAPPEAPSRLSKPRDATRTEIARMRGSWERRQIDYVRQRHPQLTDRYVDKARALLWGAYEAGERDPRVLAELGLTELEARKRSAAAAHLEAAAAAGAHSPHVLVTLAQLRYDELPQAPAPLSPQQVQPILDLVRQASRTQPHMLQTYLLAVQLMARMPGGTTDADFALLDEGARLFPQVEIYLRSVVVLHLQAGHAARARQLAELGQRCARDDQEREAFGRMLGQLGEPGP